jgi:hypothetical protein
MTMSYQFSASLRDARLNAISRTIGAAPTLKFYSAPEPLTCDHSDVADALLATMQLPHKWLADAKAGIVSKLGDWETTADDVGRIMSFRICDAHGKCHLQGSVSVAGAGGDMTVNDTIVVPKQKIVVEQFAIIGAGGPPTAADRRATTTIDDDDVDQTLGQGIHRFANALNNKIVADGESVRSERTAYGDLMRRALDKKLWS